MKCKLNALVLVDEALVKSAGKLRDRLKDRYPELHQKYQSWEPK